MGHDQSHIHTPTDGRAPRDVFVDGHQIERVFFADTERGIVDHYIHPYKLHKYRKRVLSRRIRGGVMVMFRDIQTDGS